MKSLLIITFFLITGITQLLNAQERFRRDYEHVIVDVPEEPKKSGEYNGRNIFVFNYNDNGDVLHITSDGSQIVYIRTSKIGNDQHDDGVKYSYFKAIDENGDPILIKVFQKEKYGVQLFTGLSDDEPDAVFHFLNLE